MFGLAGAHRSGKSTTAKMVAEQLGIHFHPVSISATMKEGGFDAVSDMSIEKRIEAQEYVLTRHLADLDALPRPCITDRTPLDMIGYCFGELTMHNTPAELWSRFEEYRSHAMRITDLHYDTIVCLRPLPVYEVAADKPPPNVAYQWMVQMIVEGAGRQCRHANVGFAQMTHLESRVSGLVRLFGDRIADHAELWKEYRRQ